MLGRESRVVVWSCEERNSRAYARAARAPLRRVCLLSFDDRAAEAYGTIRGDLEKQGTPIGPNDLLIAAIALANSAILITHNSREFGRVAALKMEDWE